MEEIPELAACSPRQRKFVLAIMEGRSVRVASLEAGYSYGAYGYHALKSPAVQAALTALRVPDELRRIASVAELRESLSITALDEDLKASDRATASGLLLKSAGALGPEIAIDARQQSITYQVSSGTPLAILDMVSLVQRVASGETVTSLEAARVLAGYLEPKVLDAG